MQLPRLYFPLFDSASLLSSVNSAQRLMTRNLQKFARVHVIPLIHNQRFLQWPYKITITYYTYNDINAVSLSILTAYIVRELEIYSLQSADYRVIPEVHTYIKKTLSKKKEGCIIDISSTEKQN